jgi:hypothetical protein
VVGFGNDLVLGGDGERKRESQLLSSCPAFGRVFSLPVENFWLLALVLANQLLALRLGSQSDGFILGDGKTGFGV